MIKLKLGTVDLECSDILISSAEFGDRGNFLDDFC